MIPTYHSALYLPQTLESVLSQDLGREAMQIEVIDDHSTADDPRAIVDAVGGDRVFFYRQPENGGHVHNFNTCLARARGHLIHILHGDDAVRPGFYERLGRAFKEAPDIGAAFCRVMVMGEDGHWRFLKPLMQGKAGLLENRLRRLAVDQPIQTPSIAVRRSVYEHVGGFDPRFRSSGEDLEMWMRIAADYPVWYEPEPLALYRTHEQSLSGGALRSGLNIREIRLAIDTFTRYLPPQEAGEIVGASKRRAAFWALQLSKEALAARSFRTAFNQGVEALRTSSSPSVLTRAVRVGLYGVRCHARSIIFRSKALVRRLAGNTRGSNEAEHARIDPELLR